MGQRVSDRGSATQVMTPREGPGRGIGGAARISGQAVSISAKRSPMITHGAWVLPVVMVGMIEPRSRYQTWSCSWGGVAASARPVSLTSTR